MLFKLLPLLFALGLADRIIGPGAQNTFADEPERGSQYTNGTFLTASVIEGNGCPAGTYYLHPIEPGKSAKTFVGMDNWLYNSTTSSEPVTCGINFTFKFVYPKSGFADMMFGTQLWHTSAYEEGETEHSGLFVGKYDLAATAGPNAIEASFDNARFDEGTRSWQIGVGMGPEGIPGEIATGSFAVNITLLTEGGPGQFSASRIDFGFGVM